MDLNVTWQVFCGTSLDTQDMRLFMLNKYSKCLKMHKAFRDYFNFKTVSIPVWRLEIFYQDILGKSFDNHLSVDMKKKKKEIWLSPMTDAPIPTEHSTTNWQHKNATKIFDYTMIAERLRTVNFSNNSFQLVWLNRFTNQNSRVIKSTHI